MSLTLYGKTLKSHLILGTSQYPTLAILESAIQTSQTELVTVSLKREMRGKKNDFWQLIKKLPVDILPNTAGCHSAKEAVEMAKAAREIFDTNWIKLEVILDDQTLLPNTYALVKAAELLMDEGFCVFPYCSDEISSCQALTQVGCEVLMPLASPIGSGQGIRNPQGLAMLRDYFPKIALIVDAGIGEPADATQAMQLGCDGVLLNSAIALAGDPEKMAYAFALATQAGYLGCSATRMPYREQAAQSTTLIDTPFWHNS